MVDSDPCKGTWPRYSCDTVINNIGMLTWQLDTVVKELDRGSCDTVINNIGILTWKLGTLVKDTVIKTISEYSLGSSIPFSGAVWRRAPRPSLRRMLSQIRENHTRFFSLPWTTPPPPGAAPLPASPMRSAPLLPSLKRTRRVDFFREVVFSFLLPPPPPVCWLAVRPHRHSRSPPPMVPRGRGRGGAGQLVGGGGRGRKRGGGRSTKLDGCRRRRRCHRRLSSFTEEELRMSFHEQN